MQETITTDTRQSRLGWPRADRTDEFKKLVEQSKGQVGAETFRVADFQGRTVTLPILRVSVELPKYRISNGRTASAQQEWIARHGKADGFFNMDEEVDELQEAQDQILRGMVNEEGLQSKFKDPANKQVEPVLLNELGFVINGNRRLCCWRMLLEADSEKYSHFRHIDVVVLPHCDEKELDRLEAKLQIEKDIRSDYSWDAEANMMARKMELHGFSTEEIGKLYGKKKSEVENILAMLALAGNYLESRQKKNEWSEVKGHKYAFQELLKTINGVSSHGDKELIKTGAFSLIDDSGSAGERLYEVIPKIKEHLAKVKEELETEFPLPPVETDSTAEAAFGRTKTATGNQDKSSELRLVAEIKKDEASVKKAREVIIETIRSQDDIAKERQAADYLFKTLRKMNGTFASLVGTALRPESSTKGVAKQIEEIKTAVEHVEDWLNERMNTAKE